MIDSRPLRLAAAALALSLPAGAVACGNRQDRPERLPSVIVISIDTLRQDHVGLYGHELDTTPNLDKLAEESIVFDHAYTTMTWTLIAHMSMLTGLYPSQHKVWKARSRLTDSFPTLAERLKAKGYFTLGFYEEPGWLDPRHGYKRGFDAYMPHKNIDEAERNISEALARRPRHKPLFLFVHLFDVHSAPVSSVMKGLPLYDPPPPHDDFFVTCAKQQLRGCDTYSLWYKDGSLATPEQHQAIVGLYDSAIRHVDERLGQWFDEWRASGLLDSALMIVTSDHGEGLYQRGGRYDGHGGAFEEGLVVPLLVRLPGGRFGGTRVEVPVSHVDILPTVLDVLGLEADPRLAGFSLLGPIPRDRIVYAERPQMQAIIQWPWKIVQKRDEQHARVWNLETDPGEQRPIRAERNAVSFLRVAEPLRLAIKADQLDWHYPGKATTAAPMTAEQRQALDALGYAGVEDED